MALGGITTTQTVMHEVIATRPSNAIAARVCRIGEKVIIHDADDTEFWEAAHETLKLARANDPFNGGLKARHVDALRRVFRVRKGPIIR